jgi:hypothetical protein
MKLTNLQFSLGMVDDHERTPGVHISDVIREIALRTGELDKKYGEDDSLDVLRMSLGLAWEQYIAKQHPGISFHPGEQTLEGLPMTPDGLSFFEGNPHCGVIIPPTIRIPAHTPILHEFKCTYKSSTKKELVEDWMWMSQGKCYCAGYDVRYVWWHVLYVNGNYKFGQPGSGPQYKIMCVEFNNQEIWENWQMIKNNKGLVEQVQRQKQLIRDGGVAL